MIPSRIFSVFLAILIVPPLHIGPSLAQYDNIIECYNTSIQAQWNIFNSRYICDSIKGNDYHSIIQQAQCNKRLADAYYQESCLPAWKNDGMLLSLMSDAIINASQNALNGDYEAAKSILKTFDNYATQIVQLKQEQQAFGNIINRSVIEAREKLKRERASRAAEAFIFGLLGGVAEVQRQSNGHIAIMRNGFVNKMCDVRNAVIVCW